jgi:hypothetical protein
MTQQAGRHATTEITVSAEQFRLLRTLDFPGTTEVLAAAEPGPDGMVLRMPRYVLEEFVGWVAGEANHTRGRRRAALLNDVADAMEAELAYHR